MSIGNAYTPTDRVVDANGQSILGADGRPDVTQVVQVTRVKNGVRPGTAPNQVAYLDEVYSVPTGCGFVVVRHFSQTAAQLAAGTQTFSHAELVFPVYTNTTTLNAGVGGDTTARLNINMPLGTRATTTDGEVHVKVAETSTPFVVVGTQVL